MSSAQSVSRHASRRGETLTGTLALVRFILRRDRVRLSAWVAGMAIFVVYIGTALPTLAPSEEDLASMAPIFAEPVGRMFTGPAFGMDAPTYDRFFAAGYAPYLYVLAALMSILMVTRHTRLEEQTDRAELVRANVVGSRAMLTAVLAVAGLTNALVASAVTLLALVNGYPVAGSVIVGLATGLTGMAFAGLTAVTVQLSEFARAAAGMAGAVLGAAFVIRALGDMVAVGGSAVSWMSPLGWAGQTAPFVHDRGWPLLLLAACAVGGVTLGFLLQDRRDFGASLFAVRRGRSHAHPMLGTPPGLAWRLQRGGLLAWGAGILLLGVVDGAFAQAMLDAGQDMPPAMQEVFGSEGLLEGYAAFLGSFVALLVTAYVVFGLQTLRAEETSGRTDTILAAPVGRAAWLGAHVVVVLGAALVICAVTGLGTGLAAASTVGDAGLVGQVLVSHVALLAAPVLVLGIGTALHGWAPRLVAPVCWSLVAWMAIVDFFGDLLELPAALTALSPLEHLSRPPVEDLAVGPLLVICSVALGLYLAGLLGYRRRQINVT